MTTDELTTPEREAISQCPVLRDMTDTELTTFLDGVLYERFEAGAEILSEGNHHQGLWILLSGSCEVTKNSGSQPQKLACLEPGNVFGEMSFLDSAPHSATVKALEPVHTMRLLHEEYRRLKERCYTATDKIAVNIVSILSDRLRKMDEWTCRLVEKDCDKIRHEEWQEFRAKLYTSLYE